MIIDVHAHTVASPRGPAAPSALNSRWAALEASGTFSGPPPPVEPDELLGGAELQVRLMDEVGTDIQLTSPRPFILKHSHRPKELVHWWCALQNDAVAVQSRAHPDRIKGIAALPQADGEPVEDCLAELDRCVDELGMIGVMVNPDPSEGGGTAPLLSDSYWFPLYERLVELDLPMLLHPAGCYGRESYSEHFISEESIAVLALMRGDTLGRFPDLKVVVPHGGGSIPYQIGRWRAHWQRMSWPDFDESLRRLWFDTCIYTPAALALLIDTVGSDRVVFGTERPGSGGAYEDVRPMLESLNTLSEGDRSAIFEGNALKLYSRLSDDSAQ